jgi:ABC-type nitrate/sulfonate/bicarbonate transport system ATPase subunit
MREKALAFSEVTFGFGKLAPLFDRLSCLLIDKAGAGKVIALMGPSGVGKTTFCELALGIRDPQKGSITFSPSDANVALIPQKGVIFDELSVHDNITCLKYSKSVGKTFRAERVPHALESLNLVSVLENGTPAASLSGGEAQRVMLARIQTIDCDILILDEPCSFLDNRIKSSFLSALRATVEEKRLLALMVTHVWDETQLIADEIVFFHKIQRQPVSLHHALIEDAIIRPPTVDSLFTIHWPNCAAFRRSEMSALPPKLLSSVPRAAHWIGFFHDSTEKKADSVALALWNQLHSLQENHDSHKTRRVALPQDGAVSCVFYAEDGVALRHEAQSQASFGKSAT